MWTERLFDASFKGFNFFVESSTIQNLGKRVQVYETLNSDELIIDEFGSAPKTYNLNAYLIGEDYDLKKQEFLKLLNSGGEGELIHPELGRQEVYLQNLVSINESSDRGGYCSFNLSFIAAKKYTPPEIKTSLKQTQDLSLAALTKKIEDFFDVSYLKIQTTLGKVLSLRNSQRILQLLNYKDQLASDLTSLQYLATFQDLINLFDYEKLKTLEAAETELIKTDPNSKLKQQHLELSIFTQKLKTASDKLTQSKSKKQIQELKTDLLINKDKLINSNPNLEAELSSAYILTTSYLKEIQAKTFKTFEVEYQTAISSLILCFKEFGNLDQYEKIAKNNEILNSAFIPSNTKIELAVYD